eukprot:COSAG01_NODE_18883_length_1047_cov_0.880802_1_plen_81_part_00
MTGPGFGDPPAPECHRLCVLGAASLSSAARCHGSPCQPFSLSPALNQLGSAAAWRYHLPKDVQLSLELTGAEHAPEVRRF